jgi:hypothetical protein
MRKIAIFVEGQAELAFVRQIICQLFSGTPFSFDCFKLHRDDMKEIPYALPNPEAIRHFLLVNVEGDEKVLSAIKDREEKLFERGYSKVIGIRDMYGEKYINRAGKCIDQGVNKLFIDSTQSVIHSMSCPDKITVHFSIMEVEAWWLAMPSIFPRIDSSLTCERIQEALDFRLESIDPETYFFHPAEELRAILNLAGKPYRKTLGDAEMISGKVEDSDLLNILEGNRCDSFRRFLEDIWEQ